MALGKAEQELGRLAVSALQRLPSVTGRPLSRSYSTSPEREPSTEREDASRENEKSSKATPGGGGQSSDRSQQNDTGSDDSGPKNNNGPRDWFHEHTYAAWAFLAPIAYKLGENFINNFIPTYNEVTEPLAADKIKHLTQHYEIRSDALKSKISMLESNIAGIKEQQSKKSLANRLVENVFTGSADQYKDVPADINACLEELNYIKKHAVAKFESSKEESHLLKNMNLLKCAEAEMLYCNQQIDNLNSLANNLQRVSNETGCPFTWNLKGSINNIRTQEKFDRLLKEVQQLIYAHTLPTSREAVAENAKTWLKNGLEYAKAEEEASRVAHESAKEAVQELTNNMKQTGAALAEELGKQMINQEKQEQEMYKELGQKGRDYMNQGLEFAKNEERLAKERHELAVKALKEAKNKIVEAIKEFGKAGGVARDFVGQMDAGVKEYKRKVDRTLPVDDDPIYVATTLKEKAESFAAVCDTTAQELQTLEAQPASYTSYKGKMFDKSPEKGSGDVRADKGHGMST